MEYSIMMSDRGTGRTTVMLRDAIEKMRDGYNVTVVLASVCHFDYVLSLVQMLTGPVSVTFNRFRGRITRGPQSMYLVSLNGDRELNQLRGRERGTIFIDHYVWETQWLPPWVLERL